MTNTESRSAAGESMETLTQKLPPGATTRWDALQTGMVVAVCLLVLVVYFAALDSNPRSIGDEAYYAGPTAALLRDGYLHHPALVGRGGIEYFCLDPKIILNIIAIPNAYFIGVSLLSFRLVSVVVSLLGLYGLYLLARLLFSRSAASLAVVLLSVNVWYFIASRTFRPEIFESTFLLWYMYFGLSGFLQRSPGRLFLAGVSAGFCLLSHQVSWLLLPAVTVVFLPYLVKTSRSQPAPSTRNDPGKSSTALFVAACAGAALLLVPYGIYVLWAQHVSPARFYDQVAGESSLVAPSSVWGYVLKESVRWSSFLQLPLGSIILAIYVLALWYLWRTPQQPWHRPLVLTPIAMALVFAVVVPLSTARYLSVVLPFLCLAVARAYISVAEKQRSKLGRFGLLAVLLLYGAYMSAGLGALFVSYKDASYSRMSQSIAANVGPEAKVAGPTIFWLGFHQHPYVALEWSPDFSSTRSPLMARALAERLRKERPDILLETTSDLNSTDGLGPRFQEFGALDYGKVIDAVTSQYGELRAQIDSRDFGPVRVWHLSWPSEP